MKIIKKIIQKYTIYFVFVFCLTVGFFLRSYNLNWDQGLLFHPDERNIANAVTKIIFFKQLNPQFFAYGGFSVYLYRAVADILVRLTHDTGWIMDWGKINLIGRYFSAIISTLTLFPLFFVARKLFNKKVALLSCIFYTFVVTSIQHAHFATTESSLAFFAILLCLLVLYWIENPKLWKSILLGTVMGLALATKTSALSYFVLPGFTFLMYIISNRKNFKKLLLFFPHLLFFLLTTTIFFFIFSPYTFLDSKDFFSSMQYESGVATGSLPVVYTYQFNGSTPYIFQIQNFVWQFGPMLTLFGLTGMLFLILEPFNKKQANKLLFWIFPLIYFLYVGSWHTKFLRYMTPLVPFFVISASFILSKIQQKFNKTGNILILLSLVITVSWAGAFFSIYTKPQTRIAASSWIYSNIPPASNILTEAWDDGLPVAVGSFNQSLYHEEQLDMYSTDNIQKIIYLSDKLSKSDYIVLNSRRIYGTLMRLNNQYPITSKYYKLLFAGELGYQQVGMFSSYPNLFGLTINDDSSEETFQVYEHPKVIILKNVKHYSQMQLEQIL